MKFHPFHSPWLRHWLMPGAFIITRNPSSRTFGTLFAADAILATQHPREWLEGGTFLIARRPLVNSMPCWLLHAFSLLYAIPAVRRPPWLSSILLSPFWSPARGCQMPSHQCGVHLAARARHPRGHSALPGYSGPFWLPGAIRRPPSHSAICCLL